MNFPQILSSIRLELSSCRHFSQLAHFSILAPKYRQNAKFIDNGACHDIISRKAYMKTPTPKKGAEKSIVKCGRSKGSICVTTPEKGKISRHFQSLGGDSVRGAAAATARKFDLTSTSGAAKVKKYDREICDGVASRVNRRSTGRPKKFNADMEAKIIDAWADDDTRTYREVAEDLGIPRSTLYTWVVQRGLRRINA